MKEKDPAHSIITDNDEIFVKRNRTPKFVAQFFKEKKTDQLQIIQWLDDYPGDYEAEKFLRKANAFVNSYLTTTANNLLPGK